MPSIPVGIKRRNLISPLLTESQSPIGKSFYEQTGITGSRALGSTRNTFNGLEARLPDNVSFEDYYGIRRRRIRVNWWASEQTTFRDAAVIDDGQRHISSRILLCPMGRQTTRVHCVSFRTLLDARNAADSTPTCRLSRLQCRVGRRGSVRLPVSW